MAKMDRFLNALFNFLGDPEGLSEKEIIQSLEEAGIDVLALENKMMELKAKYLPSQPDCTITGEKPGQGYEGDPRAGR